jgi:hypothetical protein
MKKALFALVLLPAVLGACATGPEPDPKQRTATRDDGDFVTGSNLPRRNRMGGDNVSVMSPEEFDRAQKSSGQATLQNMPNNGTPSR